MTPTLTTLVTGASAAVREQSIAAQLAAQSPGTSTALILEGLPDGRTVFDPTAAAGAADSSLTVIRIAPGCICCTGSLTMRVTLNRVLRRRPARLFISLATAGHLDRIRAFLTEDSYRTHLSLTDDLLI